LHYDRSVGEPQRFGVSVPGVPGATPSGDSEPGPFPTDGRGGIEEDQEGAALVAALIEGAGSAREVLATLRAHQIAPAAASSVLASRRPELAGTAQWREAAKRNRARAERIDAARSRTEAALGRMGDRVAMPRSALGSLWVHDVDVLVHSSALANAGEALSGAGFVDLDPLLARLDRLTPGVRRFAATAEHQVLASVEICTRLHVLGPSADPAIERAEPAGSGLPRLSPPDAARRRCIKVAAARRATVRDALELLALAASSGDVPIERDVAVAFRRCAELERRLVGSGTLTRIAAELPRAVNPRYLPMRARGLGRALRRRVRPHRLDVAFAGAEEASTSACAERLAELLRSLDIQAVTASGAGGAGERRGREVASAVGRGPRGAVTVRDLGHLDQPANAVVLGAGDPTPGLEADWLRALAGTAGSPLQAAGGTRA
jgi:hypothetical protein